MKNYFERIITYSMSALFETPTLATYIRELDTFFFYKSCLGPKYVAKMLLTVITNDVEA